MKYADKLKLPEWQEFRQYVLDTKGCICQPQRRRVKKQRNGVH